MANNNIQRIMGYNDGKTEIQERYSTRLNNEVNWDKGVANAEQIRKIYKEILEDMQHLYDFGAESSKIMTESAIKVGEVVNKAKYGVQEAKTAKNARNDAYEQAKKEATKNGDVKTLDKLRAQERKDNIEANKKFNQEQLKTMKDTFGNIANGIFTFNPSELADGFKALKENLKDMKEYYGSKGGAMVAIAGEAVQAMSKFTKGLESTIKSIAGYKTAWDTRLFGSTKDHTSIADLVKKNLAISPYVKQEKVMDKLNTAISEGIAYNVEQRAFLSAISDSIATTFDAFDTTLKDLVRVQQADSTAYRLGMEASLNQYLNSMFQTTEYLSNVSDTVTSNLYQATSLLDASKAIGYEYQVQKWLGALYSVGMSSGAVGNISQALGQLLSGDISGTDSGAGKLLVMAAANSGLDYAKLLTDGINDSDVNLLLSSMVDYLQEIASDNKVVQSQMANIFGLQTSDIQAAGNLSGYVTDIYKSNSNYSSSRASGMLDYMLGSVGERMSLSGMLTNLADNFKYTLAEGIAGNPALYSILTIGDLLEETVGGINIPTITAFGTGVDLETTVADLLRSVALGGSIMTGIGSMFAGLGDLGSGLTNAFNRFASNSTSSVSIGKGLGTKSGSGGSLMSMNYKGNMSSDDYTSANAATVDDSKNEAMVDSDVNSDAKTTDDVYTLLEDFITEVKQFVADNKSINVDVDWDNMPKQDGTLAPGGLN